MKTFSLVSKWQAVYIFIAAILVVSGGCASIDPVKERERHTDDFTTYLQTLEQRLLSHPFTLEECIQIAMTNNYTVRKADLDVQLAKFNRAMAFSAFLPQAVLSSGYTGYNKDPVSNPKDFRTTTLQVSMPVLAPATWFLYGAAKNGYASSKIAAAYIRQSITLQTSISFYTLLVQQDTVKALESQLAAAQELARRMDGLAEEGFLTAWERDQAKLMAESREMELNHARRQQILLQGELLQALGLSPLAHIELSRDFSDVKAPEGSVEELVLQALEIHPELSLADRKIVMLENQVRQALAGFIPVVSIFAQQTWYNKPMMDSPAMTTPAAIAFGNFTAVWNVFTGIANITQHRAAKTAKAQGWLERESTFLSVIVRVVSAEAALQDTREQRQVAQRSYDVAKGKSEDYDARLEEGLIPSSDALDARAAMDAAQLQLVQSQYLERIAIASLELAMGIIGTLETEEE